MAADSFGAAGSIEVSGSSYRIFRVGAVEGAARLPFSLKVLPSAEAAYYRHGGILSYVLRRLAGR